MFKENFLENQIQNDIFQIIHNYRAKFIRPKAKYVRKAPKNNISNVVQPPKNIDQYKNQRKMTADSELQLQLQNNHKQTGVQEILNELLGPNLMQQTQNIEIQNVESFFYEKELQMPILIGSLFSPEPNCYTCKVKEYQNYIEDQYVNQEVHWSGIQKNQLNLNTYECTNQKLKNCKEM